MKLHFDKLKNVIGSHDRTLITEKHVTHIDTNYRETFNDFLKVKTDRHGYFGMPFYSLIPMYSECVGFKSSYYMNVEYKTDLIEVLFKDITMGQSFIRLMGMPTSRNRRVLHELMVLDTLVKNKLINQIVVNETDIERFSYRYNVEDDPPIYYEDFFMEVPLQWKYYSRSKWRSKRGINKAAKNSDLKFVALNHRDWEEMEELLHAWQDYKDDIGEDIMYRQLVPNLMKKMCPQEGSLSEFFEAYEDRLSREVYAYGFKYKERLISVIMFCPLMGSKYMQQLVNYSIARCQPEYYENVCDEFLEWLLPNLGASIMYHSTKILEFAGVQASFAAGNLGTNFAGRGYKEIHNTAKNNFYKFPLTGEFLKKS